MHSAWDVQLPSLVDAYLHWKHRPATVLQESQEWIFHVTRIGVFGAFLFFFFRRMLQSKPTYGRLGSNV